MAGTCTHISEVRLTSMSDGGCEECIVMGDTWVHLRCCVRCGYTGCCDASKNQHASKHWRSTGHEVIRSKEPGEQWVYCYEHDIAARVD